MKRKAEDTEPLSPITNSVRPSRKPRMSIPYKDMLTENNIQADDKDTLQENNMIKVSDKAIRHENNIKKGTDKVLMQENTDILKLNFVQRISVSSPGCPSFVKGIQPIKQKANGSQKVPRQQTKDCSVNLIRLDIDLDETIKTEPHRHDKLSDRDKVLRSLGGFLGMGEMLAHLLDGEDADVRDSVAAFLLFLLERQNIWERRRRDPQSKWEIRRWESLERRDMENKLTQNKVMSVYFFTNLYRELDKGTVFFRNQISTTDLKSRGLSRELNEDILKKVLYKSTVYRLLNQINTFKEFGCIPDFNEWEDFETFLYGKKDRKETIFTSAHQPMGFDRYLNSIGYVRENLDSLTDSIFRAAEDRSLARCFHALTSIPNVGDFLAWQVLCDLLEAQVLGRCTENQWTKLGPGAIKGIKKIFGNDLSKTELEYTRLLRDICVLEGEESGFEALGVKFPALFGHKLSLKNIEHALCEFDKYWRHVLTSEPGGRKYNVATPPDLSCCVLCGQKVGDAQQEANIGEGGDAKEGSEKKIKRLCKICTIHTEQWEKDYDYDEDEEDPEYEVESIVDHRMVNGDIEYLVKWRGYDDENTWEPEAHLSCEDIIETYMMDVKDH